MPKVRKSMGWNQGLGPENEPLPTMLQEAWSSKTTNGGITTNLKYPGAKDKGFDGDTQAAVGAQRRP